MGTMTTNEMHQINPIELGETDEVDADEDVRVAKRHSALLTGVTLMLEMHPELVRLDKVGQDKRNRVLEGFLMD